MDFINVESSNIAAIAFKDNKIFVKFKNNKIYSYDYTEEEFKRFQNAPSKGKFFHENIKGLHFEVIDYQFLEINNLKKLKEDLPKTEDPVTK